MLECKPTKRIRTEEDFHGFCSRCDSSLGRCFLSNSGITAIVNTITSDSELFKREKGKIKSIDISYKKISTKEVREIKKLDKELKSQDLYDLVCKKLETIAFRDYKHFTRKGIGFEYRCVDGLKIQHNIQGRQKIGLTKRKLQFFKKQQLKQQSNNLQDVENDMVFRDARSHD